MPNLWDQNHNGFLKKIYKFLTNKMVRKLTRIREIKLSIKSMESKLDNLEIWLLI